MHPSLWRVCFFFCSGVSDFLRKCTLHNRTTKKGKTMNNYMENTEYIKEYLDADDWHYETREFADEHRVVFSGGIGGFKGLYGSFRFLVIVGDEEAQCYAMLPASAKDKLPEMAEFIARANYGLKYGAFEMDYRDGEVRFHLTFPMVALRADRDLIVNLFGLPAKMLDQYSTGFIEVLMGIKAPEEAIADCERK